jgi:hypothetical protein
MKRSWTAVAALLAFGMIAGCGGVNNSIQFNTGATITNISPSAAEFGGKTDFTLTVTAIASNGFQSNTIVEWNGQKLVTQPPLNATTITATVPHAMIANPGTAYVNVFAPQSGAGNNGLSNALAFLIYGQANPVPTLTSVSPSSTGVCASKCANVNITLTGTNFLPVATNGGSSVTYTGLATLGVETAINVTSISSTQIKAVIPGTYLSQNDTAMINVINPPSAVCVVNCPNLGGGDTNAPGNGTTQTFTIGTGAAQPTTSATSSGSATAAEETPAVSQDGRYVAYASQQDETTQIFLRDTCVGAQNGCTPSTQMVSTATDGTAGNAESHAPVMSSDGRYVAFSSAATNLVEGAAAGRQVYLRDTCMGAAAACKAATSLISTDSTGALNGTEGILPSISASGRFVAFVAVTKSQSASSTGATANPSASATASPNSGLRQVFVRDTCLGATECTPKTTRISLQPGDGTPNATKPAAPALSGLAKQIALPDGKTSTVFTPTVPVDGRVFLATVNGSN